MGLPEINARWAELEHSHAVLTDDDRYQWHCPRCHSTGVTRLPLLGAMNSALAHKNRCPAVS